MIHEIAIAHILQKRDENNIENFLYHYSDFVATHAFRHKIYGCVS